MAPETRDFLAFSLWCGITFVQFPYDELLLYPLALYYAWAVWRDQVKILPLLTRGWILLLYPAWCVISPLWAVVPMAAVKHSVYLTLTMMICLQVSATIGPRRIVHAVLLATGAIAVINLLYSASIGDFSPGIFPHKNIMGVNMVVLWVVATLVMLDRGSAPWIRWAAVILAANAAVLISMSDSATAVLLMLGTGMVNASGAVFLQGGFFRASRISSLCFVLAGVATVGCFVLPNLQMNVVDAVLDAFGKDSTLTGRTELWGYAKDQIAERPLLGVGAGGFWRYYDSPLVQKIYQDFYRSPNAIFDFHNSHYQIAVHQGFIGLFLAWLALVWGLRQVIRGAFVLGKLPYIYFLSHSSIVAIRSMTEADFLKPFVLFHMILWIGALSVLRDFMSRTNQTVSPTQEK
jgi:exopolysaccharide production protein ExoQ